MPSIIYNDDVEMYDPSYYDGSNNNSSIDDESSHGSNPWIAPYPVNDSTSRPSDGWIVDNNPNGGTGGTEYHDTPPEEKEPLSYSTKIIKKRSRTVIRDYSTEYLQNLYNQGCKFYVIYKDGTEDEISYTEIYNPYEIQTTTCVNEAYDIANATNQHFWTDTNGAHVTDIEQDDWETAASSNFNDLSDSKPYHNILMNSLGILLRRALYNLVSVSKSAIAFYDGLGNSTTNILASFGRSGIQIGATDRKHLIMNENGAAVYNADGSLAAFNAQNIQSDHVTIGNIQNSISDISTIRTNSQKVSDLTKSDIESVLTETRFIYISKASGTLSVSDPTAKVTETGDVQNTWTLKRPTYDPNYPVLFVGTQSTTAKGTTVFTTAIKDDTLTVIDGGHITTGTIDAARIAVNQITVGSLQDGADYATKALALNNFQQVYISKPANTTEMSAPSAWITNAADVQNQWTTTKPTYNTSYPNVFISRQTKTADNSVASSIPYLDKSTDDAISAAASDATTKANNAKSEAISAAASDATTKANAVNTALESYKTTTNTTLTNLQNQVDGQIEAWYKNVDPTTSNDPASSWNTDVLKARHVGDLYYNVSNGHSWRWMQSGSSYTWQQIPDSDAAAALSVAQNAQNVANSKRRIFTTTPTVPYDVGDLWVSGSEVKYCSTSKTSHQSYASSDWTVTATDDTLAQAAKSVADAAATPTDVATAKNEAISAAASDATTKANNAKSEAISAAATNASTTYATKTDAVEEVQIIYISKDSSTSSVSANTTWVTSTTDTYDTWTTTRPSYNSSYPKVFTAKQTKKNDGTITCTTPTLDTSTTDAISTAAADATTKANAAAKTATDYITVIDNNGIKVHASNNPDTNYSRIDADGLNVIKNSISVAKFGETARVGKLLKGYIEIGVNSSDNGYIDMYNANTLLCHIGYDAGTDASGGTSLAPYYNLGLRQSDTVIGNYSCVEGYNNVASGYSSHAEGWLTKVDSNGYYAHAEGRETEASSSCAHAEGYKTSVTKDYAHAEGRETTANGNYSHVEGYKAEVSGNAAHAEGNNTRASGGSSHAEGENTGSSGGYSHAEGYGTSASNTSAHAEGYNTSAEGKYSHTSGLSTTAASDCQFVCGKYNKNNSSDLFEVGNGSGTASSQRSNAFRVTTSNTAYAGSVNLGSDKRIKTDLGELDKSQAIDFIKFLIPHKYEKFGRKELGFFAQDVEKDPNYGDILVDRCEDHGYKDFRSLSYDGLIAPIVSVEQNLINRIESLEKENSKLKEENKQLNERISKIEKVLGI